MNHERHSDLGDWLRLAYGSESTCPSPEVIHEALVGDLSPEQTAGLHQHMARCPACAAEHDLAELFEAPPETGSGAGLEAIVARLERESPLRSLDDVEPTTPDVLHISALRRLASAPVWSLAAAALLILGVGVTMQTLRAPRPSLPAPTQSTERGSRLEALHPIGDTTWLPAEFRWDPVDGSSSYRVTLAGVDETVIWAETVRGATAKLPDEVRESLHPMVVYLWKVEALDENNARLAWSEWTRMKILPPGGPDALGAGPV